MPSGSFVVLAKGGFNFASEPAPPGTYVELYTVTSVSEVSREEFALSGKVTRLGLVGRQLLAFRDRGAQHLGVRPVRAAGARRDSGGRPRSRVTSSRWRSRRRVSKPGRRLLVRGTARARRRRRGARGDTGRRSRSRRRGPQSARDRPAAARAAACATAWWCTPTWRWPRTAKRWRRSWAPAMRRTPFQRFELKQLPLTYRAAANELGASAELTVRVDDIAWKPRDTLFGSDAAGSRLHAAATTNRAAASCSSATACAARVPRAAEQCARHVPQGPGRRGQSRRRKPHAAHAAAARASRA